jgi:hypothetical protein
MPRSKLIIAAGRRFVAARQAQTTRHALHLRPTEDDLAEMHDAALQLMWATETTDLQAAIDAFLVVPS